jgi:hypothetical protein
LKTILSSSSSKFLFERVLFKQVSRRDGPLPVSANQLPVERLVVAYIGQSACQALGTRESSGFAGFHGKM